MDFFTYQDAARRKTAVLVAYYVAAVALIILGVYVAFVLVLTGAGAKAGGETVTVRLWHPDLFTWVVGGTVLVVIAGTFYKIAQLSSGGEAVARMLGGRPIARNTIDSDERKVLNVVEEMAIASGTPVPQVFVLDDEPGINAFAAGFSPNNAVIGVTRGSISSLTRDELQGVIAHEFSHILNGDMRLNIRLIGVLNGILVLALIGYAILRGGSRASRVRSRGKGGGAILLFGLLLMIIGYVGVFFGKLIKSAVSRQREFLADASAVQFTRNPPGIAGALKKIGGFVQGSRLQTSRAEEASHFFFANGVASTFANLMATHPPLEERIRRVDPSFDGTAAKAPQAGASVAGALVGLVSSIAGHGAPQSYAADPAEVIARVGAPQLEHLVYAKELVAALPPRLEAAAREPFAARAVLYCLLLNRDRAPRGIQIESLEKNADSAVHAETVKLAPLVEQMDDRLRLVLADFAVGALKDMSGAQYERFRADVERLVDADGQMDLFEYALQRMIIRRLDPVFRKSKPPVTQYYSLKPLLPVCGQLVSCLALWGTDDRDEAASAFARGMEQLDSSVAMTPQDRCGLKMVDEALSVLAAASPAVKKQVLTACIACVGADGVVNTEEAELLRAVADSLDCPIPPFLPGQRV
jgi:Zn-dependent protease with chaperone function